MNWLENLQRSFFDWEAMASVLPTMLAVGLKNTLILAAASTVIGVLLGMVLAVMGISRSAWLRIPARVYTDIFRGLPAILTILLIGQGFARIGRDIFGPSPYPLASSHSASSPAPISARSFARASRVSKPVRWKRAARSA